MSDLPEREQVIIYLLQQIDLKTIAIVQLQAQLQSLQTQQQQKPEPTPSV